MSGIDGREFIASLDAPVRISLPRLESLEFLSLISQIHIIYLLFYFIIIIKINFPCFANISRIYHSRGLLIVMSSATSPTRGRGASCPIMIQKFLALIAFTVKRSSTYLHTFTSLNNVVDDSHNVLR